VVVVRMMFRVRSLPVIVSAVAVAADIRFNEMLAGARFAHPFQFDRSVPVKGNDLAIARF
jgi:hypothetical protein